MAETTGHYVFHRERKSGLEGYIRFGENFGSVLVALLEARFRCEHTIEFSGKLAGSYGVSCTPPLTEKELEIFQRANYMVESVSKGSYQLLQQQYPELRGGGHLGIDGGR